MRDINHNARLTIASLLAVLLGTYLYSADASAEDSYQDFSRVNGSISIEAGQSVGDVSTVNGVIRLRDGVTAGSAKTINGNIAVGRDSSVGRLETINGDISVAMSTHVDDQLSTINGEINLREDVIVTGRVSSVNGTIRLASGTEVADDLRTANGDIHLRNALVAGNLQTRGGDIELLDGSQVDGDIIIKENRNWWNRLWTFGSSREPRLRIDNNSTVLGDIHLYRKVELDIADEANIGEIIQH